MSGLCLVDLCRNCQGAGQVPRFTARAQLQGYVAPAAYAEQVPCPKCVNGFIFIRATDAELLGHLMRALKSDASMRRQFFDLFVQATEEKMLDGSAQGSK